MCRPKSIPSDNNSPLTVSYSTMGKTTLINREKHVFAHEVLRITHGDDEGDHA
jgi:hypothetical protein